MSLDFLFHIKKSLIVAGDKSTQETGEFVFKKKTKKKKSK